MRNIKLTIQYDGTNYSGWQSQKNGLAIQDIIERALKRLTGKGAKLTGSGRTDAGVHAAGQVANFRTESPLSLERIRKGLNSYLPPDIVISKAEKVSEDFHSRYSAKNKHYRYTLYTDNPAPPLCRNSVTALHYKLDLEMMKREAKALVGRHDFSAFQGSRSMRKDAVRNIRRLDVHKKGGFIYFDIEADGFLYNMVRSIAGTLIDAGRGRFKEGSIKRILNSRDRQRAGHTAPAKGLSLLRVRY
ncbi:MAG: tRNA pseudouridine(38-40) synthase TruA [Candidatus Omnitrophica bacterium]|nr:tRNA pseudouridine(38-40) synthase TruA [Candidatus Omnitrophota bacterium]